MNDAPLLEEISMDIVAYSYRIWKRLFTATKLHFLMDDTPTGAGIGQDSVAYGYKNWKGITYFLTEQDCYKLGEVWT